VTSDEGTSALANDMGFVCPFKSAKASTNPLVKIANQYVADGKASVAWCFTTMPSEEWKNGVGTALTAYAAGTGRLGRRQDRVCGRLGQRVQAGQRLISRRKAIKLIPMGERAPLTPRPMLQRSSAGCGQGDERRKGRK
jgi:hypothetical protein